MRVQIPAYTDRWMMGDRYGEVVSVRKRWDHWPDRPGGPIPVERSMREIATVKLDISGRTIKVILDDCTEVALGTDGDNFDGSGEWIVYPEGE